MERVYQERPKSDSSQGRSASYEAADKQDNELRDRRMHPNTNEEDEVRRAEAVQHEQEVSEDAKETIDRIDDILAENGFEMVQLGHLACAA
jgi:hypothetical protein